MRYNLACYECQLGNLDRAKRWLEKAFELGDARNMKLAALDDPDLEPAVEGDWQNLNNGRYQGRANSEDAKAFYALVPNQGGRKWLGAHSTNSPVTLRQWRSVPQSVGWWCRLGR